MIVRVATVGQYRMPDENAERLNQLDNEAVAAVEAGDEARFLDLFRRMIELVRTGGEAVPDDELVESDVVLPPPDTTMAEAEADFTGEGLIPG